MLVVIGIILVVLGLASPMIMRAWRAGDRAKTSADLSAIAAGLEAYKADHGDYPRVEGVPYGGATDKNYNGARMLCRALIGPGPETGPATGSDPTVHDGADGSGFRLRGAQGRVYGPYLSTGSFKIGNPAATANPNAPPIGLWAILDKYGKPILYYPATGKPNVRQGTGTFITDYDPANPPKTGRPLYNARDNVGAMPLKMFSTMMGDLNANSKLDATATPPEVPAYEGPFILWSAGPDETFGIVPPVPTTPGDIEKAVGKSDDITNFRQ